MIRFNSASLSFILLCSTAHYTTIQCMQAVLAPAQAEEIICTFCEEEFSESAVITLSCEHTHHTYCLEGQLEKQYTEPVCPTCSNNLSRQDKIKLGIIKEEAHVPSSKASPHMSEVQEESCVNPCSLVQESFRKHPITNTVFGLLIISFILYMIHNAYIESTN